MSSPSRRAATSSLEAVRRIDRECDRFEQALQAGERPEIETYCDLAEPADREKLFQALLDVELEYRRAWGERPTADEYIQRFPQGHSAIIAAFQIGPPADTTPSDLCLIRMAISCASGRRADRLRIYYRGKLVHTTLLTGPLELGRQRPGEASPFERTQGKNSERLIVAPLTETTVSRHHAFLLPEGDDQVRVTNLSRVNPVIFKDNRKLDADQSDTFPMTLEMTLGAVFVRIDRPADPSDSTDPEDSATIDDSEDSAAPTGGFLRRLWSRLH